jgi:hypothetical protein
MTITVAAVKAIAPACRTQTIRTDSLTETIPTDDDAAAQDVQAAISVAGKALPQSLTIPPTYRK